MQRFLVLSLTASCFALIACGAVQSTSSPLDGGSPSDGGPAGEGGDAAPRNDGGAGSDASNDGASADGGACVTEPKAGDACTAGQVSCDRVDPCCTQTVVCDPSTGKWKDSGINCFQCESFACGTQTCAGGSVCLTRASGIGGGGNSYECMAMPAACLRNWSCDCITKHVPASCTLPPSNGCTEQGVHVTLSCMGA